VLDSWVVYGWKRWNFKKETTDGHHQARGLGTNSNQHEKTYQVHTEEGLAD